MKKIITLLVLILSVTLVFTSCEFIDSIKDAFTGNSPIEGSVVWSPNVKATMIFREETDDISSLYQHIYTTTGIAPSTAPVHSAEVEHEIVIGDTGRQISTVAYSKLDRFADFYSLKADGNSAYLIYADGGSIAVAYTDTYSRYAAIDYLMQNSDKRGFAADGVVVKEKFDTMEYIAEQRNALREEGFVKVEKEHGKQTADALRMVYSLFTEDYYSLIANLYDPGVGGFYYSVSARDNYGYLPDIESTGKKK